MFQKVWDFRAVQISKPEAQSIVYPNVLISESLLNSESSGQTFQMKDIQTVLRLTI